MLFGGCDADDAPSTPSPVAGSEVSKESAEERAKRAMQSYAAAKSSSYENKHRAFTDVVSLYWDTPAAGAALNDLTILLLDPARHKGLEAWPAIRSFVRRRPDDSLGLAAVDMFFNNIEQRIHDQSEDAADYAKILPDVRKLRLEAAKQVTARDDFARDYSANMVLAFAHFSAGEMEACNDVLARMSTWDELTTSNRFKVLKRRADFLRENLGRPKQALAVYREAAKMLPEVESTFSTEWVESVRSAVRELETGAD